MEIIPNEIYLKIVLNAKNFKGKGTLEEIERSMIAKLQVIVLVVKK